MKYKKRVVVNKAKNSILTDIHMKDMPHHMSLGNFKLNNEI